MENSFLENLDEIIGVLRRIEIENVSEDPEIRSWLLQITSEEFKLIEIFIVIFIENLKNEVLTDNIIKILR
jgi:hypothetical protein